MKNMKTRKKSQKEKEKTFLQLHSRVHHVLPPEFWSTLVSLLSVQVNSSNSIYPLVIIAHTTHHHLCGYERENSSKSWRYVVLVCNPSILPLFFSASLSARPKSTMSFEREHQKEFLIASLFFLFHVEKAYRRPTTNTEGETETAQKYFFFL